MSSYSAYPPLPLSRPPLGPPRAIHSPSCYTLRQRGGDNKAKGSLEISTMFVLLVLLEIPVSWNDK